MNKQERNKKQFTDDVLSALFQYEKMVSASQLKENRINKKPVEIQANTLKHQVDKWKELFDDDVYKEICGYKYQLDDKLSDDEIMVFHDLHPIEIEKNGAIEVTTYCATERGKNPLYVTTKATFK